MAKVISLFNHKGGVSKTTTVFHLGWKMASLGKKVLMVDADPQCNLTGLTLGLDDYNALFAFYDSKQNTDIFNSLTPVFMIESSTASSSMEQTTPTKTKHDNLFILAGNIRFSEIDIQIATALTSSRTIPALSPFVGALNKLIRDTARRHNFDIVLIDMSPSVSATNQCILMSSDYFIIPVSPDFYCYQAVDSLSNIIPKWNNDISDFREKNSDYALPKSNPQMLGFISQNYRIYTTENQDDLLNNQSGNRQQKDMSKAYKAWLEKIKMMFNQRLVPALEKNGMIISEDIFKSYITYDDPYHLAGIQNFNSLIPVSQKVSKPIYALEKGNGGWTGALWERKQNGKDEGFKFKIEEANAVYTKLTEAILKIINLY